ncbi:hypothetical protein [Filimonas lacunae]|uniref:hypothetical protein n=1 Tax=Filimonas lacunae TaxID=477680 RepID=UPI001185EADC|nr:hypothetical protein [Filimonas lacunae]
MKKVKVRRTVYGTAFQMRILRQYPQLFPGGSLRFDNTIDNLEGSDDFDGNISDMTSKCLFDIIVNKADYFEFKRWGNQWIDTFANKIEKRVTFSRQLWTYLRYAMGLLEKADEWLGPGGTVETIARLNELFDREYVSAQEFKTELQTTNTSLLSFIQSLN